MAKNKVKSKKNGLARQLINMPTGSVGISTYADWVEISVWAQSDGQISRHDIISLFIIEEEARGINEITSESEELVSQIWYEIKTRILELKKAYPFRLSSNEEIFYLTKEDKINLSYIFCLVISYFGLSSLMNGNTSKASNLFEGLCTYVACKYLSDDIGENGYLQFGAPRTNWKNNLRPFPKAVDELIKYMGDGINRVSGVRVARRIVADGGDGGLDIVAWRKFPDKRLGYLLFFGQCATAKDYNVYLGKLFEHQTFLQNYLNTDLAPIFGFFLPHSLTVNDEENKGYWEQIKRSKNIPFDRNRIALYGDGWSNVDVNKFLPKFKIHIQSENSLI